MVIQNGNVDLDMRMRVNPYGIQLTKVNENLWRAFSLLDGEECEAFVSKEVAEKMTLTDLLLS